MSSVVPNPQSVKSIFKIRTIRVLFLVSSPSMISVLLFLLGAALVIYTLYSAIKTLVLPRSARDTLTSLVFYLTRLLFNIPLRWLKRYKSRDRLMAYYAPVSLVSLLPVWLFLVLIGFAAMFWALGMSWYLAFRVSGSSLLTLGFADQTSVGSTILEFIEAAIGLILIALLIAYLPSIYAAFSRRETLVTLLDVRAGTPPSPVEMLARYHRIHGLDQLPEQWKVWESWFADIEESHTSLPALVFFRSPRSGRSWVAASGAVLDAAALAFSAVDVPESPNAALCIRAGYLALRHIADYFRIPYNLDPHFPEQSISISQSEFNLMLDSLAERGIPLKPDRQQAWLSYAGWRVNYDQVLLALSDLTMSPLTSW